MYTVDALCFLRYLFLLFFVFASRCSRFRVSDFATQPAPPSLSTYKTGSRTFGWRARAKRRERQPSLGMPWSAMTSHGWPTPTAAGHGRPSPASTDSCRPRPTVAGHGRHGRSRRLVIAGYIRPNFRSKFLSKCLLIFHPNREFRTEPPNLPLFAEFQMLY